MTNLKLFFLAAIVTFASADLSQNVCYQEKLKVIDAAAHEAVVTDQPAHEARVKFAHEMAEKLCLSRDEILNVVQGFKDPKMMPALNCLKQKLKGHKSNTVFISEHEDLPPCPEQLSTILDESNKAGHEGQRPRYDALKLTTCSFEEYIPFGAANIIVLELQILANDVFDETKLDELQHNLKSNCETALDCIMRQFKEH